MKSDILKIDTEAVADTIVSALQYQVSKQLRRRGVVVGISGGIDSSVVAALCARTFGPGNVLGLLMPERDSDPESVRLGNLVTNALGINSLVEDIGPILDGAGCYKRRDDFIRRVFPDFGPGHKCKLVLPNVLDGGYNLSWLVVEAPSGTQRRVRPPLEVYLGIVAASNMKQRTRKGIEYYHADRLNYVVAGTPNRLEYDQGFFVKNGDGSADIKPIAHLYKTQVYQLAASLGVPSEICQRTPTTDTYSLPQTQEEFYFSLPYGKMDICLYALNHGISATDAAGAAGLTVDQVELVWKDIKSKRRATMYQHARPLLVEPVSEVNTVH